jgi:glycosyltransferase involved in cell wall biosynthesis
MARITIDYTPAIHQFAGIGRLTREVVRALLRLDAPHHFRLFCMGRPRAYGIAELSGLVASAPHASMAVTPLNDRWLYRLWHRARLPVPVEMFSGQSDLYHATDFVLPPVMPGKRTVLTVHDLTFERAPDAAPPQLLRFLKRIVPRSVRRATHLIADSQATANDLTALYDAPPERITVIYSGVDARFSPLDAPSPALDALRRKYALGDAPFALTVGTLQPRKNHLTLARAFAQVVRRLPNFHLVIAGGKGWMYDDVTAEVARLNLNDRVRFIGFVDDADLPDLYRAARVFAFPSLYEGFGLPPLEAMACGVPVVASNASSLPEVVGDAGLLVDPLDVDGLAEALTQAAADDAWRAQAITRGLARARQFTWTRAAEQLLAVYDAILNA